MTNRCPKCDGDRFESHQTDKKDPNSRVLTLVYTDKDGVETKDQVEDGMAFVLCAWCHNKVLFIDPSKSQTAPLGAVTTH